MSKTIRFNTGRSYSERGQRITVYVGENGVVLFNDHDRGIDGTIDSTLPGWAKSDETIARWVVAKYDRCQYFGHISSDTDKTAVKLNPAVNFQSIPV